MSKKRILDEDDIRPMSYLEISRVIGSTKVDNTDIDDSIEDDDDDDIPSDDPGIATDEDIDNIINNYFGKSNYSLF